MTNFDQRRLDFLFGIDNIKTNLMRYIAPGVNLKIVADLGYKDKDCNKRRFYEETRYKSNKYKNIDQLISANFKVDTYLVLEYPNLSGNSDYQNCGLVIRAYAINEMISKMREMVNSFRNTYKFINGKLNIISSKMHKVSSYISQKDSIVFSSDLFENNMTNTTEIGVRITINDDYSFVVSGETTFQEMIYRLEHCDLTLYGIQMIQSYLSFLPGMATYDVGSGNYNGTKRYKPYWGEDPEDIANRPESVKVNGKPLNRQGKINSFFNNL